MDPGDLSEELLSYLPSFPKYTTAAAMLGMSAYRYVRKQNPPSHNWANVFPNRTMPISQSGVNTARLDVLSRRVARIAPAVENIVVSRAVTANASATTSDDYSLSGALPTNAEMASKYLGDKWRNIKLHLRFNFAEQLNAVRVIVYKPLTTGDSLTGISDLQNIPDPTRFRVLYDTLAFPAHGNQQRKNFIKKDIPLSFLTVIDRSAAATGTVRSGEIRIIVVMENTTATARSLAQFYMLKFQNK